MSGGSRPSRFEAAARVERDRHLNPRKIRPSRREALLSGEGRGGEPCGGFGFSGCGSGHLLKSSLLSFLRLVAVWGALYFILFFLQGCNCEVEFVESTQLNIRIVKPYSGQTISGRVEFFVKLSPEQEVDSVKLFIQPLASKSKLSQKKIAELYKKPYRFFWNSWEVRDGRYSAWASAVTLDGRESSSRKVFLNIQNEFPRLEFVNCRSGQFARGKFSLLVRGSKGNEPFVTSPVLLLNSAEIYRSITSTPPFRYLIDTSKFRDGALLHFRAEVPPTPKGLAFYPAECQLRVDNTPPSVRFLEPREGGDSLPLFGRSFRVSFQAYDRWGVREVRLWIDGSNCSSEPSKGGCRRENRWIGTKPPLFPIEVKLSGAYRGVTRVSLVARAVDKAGNISDPPARLIIRIDPLPPEVFILSPGVGEIIESSITFKAKIVDNTALEKVLFFVKTKSKSIPILSKELSGGSSVEVVTVGNPEQKFGKGRHYFYVEARDRAGNVTVTFRTFAIGCVDTSDCPPGLVCHKGDCLKPAGENEPCSDRVPCGVGFQCVESSTPYCGTTRRSFCRRRCHPGNEFVSPEPCQKGFFCSKRERVCLPGDGCRPLSDDCGPGKQCVLTDDDSGICMPIGPVPPNGSCSQSCSPYRNCQRGYWCVFYTSSRRSACAKICDTLNPKCPAGTRCVPLVWSFGSKPLRYGTCQ